MAKTSIILGNKREVIADFKNQGKAFDAAIAKSMKIIGKQLANSQRTILSQRVIEWTGALAKSIKSIPTKRSVRVGGTIAYTDWIEAGGRGGFMGYWYMKTSLSMNKGFIISRLRKDMKVHKSK